MGIFASLFGRKGFAELAAQADRYWEAGEMGLARSRYEAALGRFEEGRDDALSRDRARARVAEAGDGLATESLESAESYLEVRRLEEAEEALRHAKDLAVDPALRARIEAAEERLELAYAGGPAEVGATLLFDEAEVDFEDLFDQYLLALPDAQARVYRTLGEDFARGFVALHGGDAAGAIECLERAVAERSDSPFAHRELGRALLFGERPAEAVEPLRHYHEAAADDAAGVRDLAQALQAAERWDEALATLEAEAARRPDSPRALLAVAEHHLLRAEWEKSALAAHKALGLTEAPGGALGGARSALRAGSGEGAMRRSAQEAGVDEGPPPRIHIFRVLGQAHTGAGRVDDAIEAFENVLKEHWRYEPESETISFDRDSGWLLANLYVEQRRRLDRAVEILHALLTGASATDRVAVLLRLAQVHQIRGRKKEAVDFLARARALVDPRDTESLARLDALGLEIQA